MLVIDLLARGYQTRKPHLAELVTYIRALIQAKQVTVTFVHVRGHAGNPGNERANALARNEARKAKRLVT